MNEFFEQVPGLEQSTGGNMETVQDTVQQISREADLGALEAGWLTDLFNRAVDFVEDVLDINVGCDTERIWPKNRALDEVSTPAVERYDLTEATEEWHMQDAQNSCAICAQQFIINEFLDLDVTEAELEAVAQEHGWYDKENGTTPYNADNLLELYGIDTHINEQGTMADIKATLDQGGRVIAGVDGVALWVDGYGNYPLSGADHAIEVIGLDEADPDNVKVIINDPGTPDGCGKAVPVKEFEEAWLISGGFMISAMPNN